MLCALPGFAEPRYGRPGDDELVLNTTGKNQWNCSSKVVHIPMVVEIEPHNRMTMHPQDAAKRGVRNGGMARVYNAFGSIEVRVTVSPSIMPGSLHLSSGYGQRGRQTDPTARLRGSNPNELTDNGNVDPVAGGEGVAAVVVKVEAVT